MKTKKQTAKCTTVYQWLSSVYQWLPRVSAETEAEGSDLSDSILGYALVILQFWASTNCLQLSLKTFLLASPLSMLSFLSEKISLYFTKHHQTKQSQNIWYPWLQLTDLYDSPPPKIWKGTYAGLDCWSNTSAFEKKIFWKILATENSSASKLLVKHVLSCIKSTFLTLSFVCCSICFSLHNLSFLCLSCLCLAFFASLFYLSHLSSFFLFILWNSTPLVLASPLHFIHFSCPLIGGSLHFGLCGLPCTFQLFFSSRSNMFHTMRRAFMKRIMLCYSDHCFKNYIFFCFKCLEIC